MDTQDSTTTAAKPDREALYRDIASTIADAIEKGAVGGRYEMPWNASPLTHRSVEGRAYRGLNVLLLGIAQMARGFGAPVWGTVRAWNAAGGKVRQGERGTRVVLWKATRGTPPWHDQEGDAGDGAKPPRARLYARAFTVFNLSQVEGIDPDAYASGPRPLADLLAPDVRVLDAIKGMGVPLHWGGNRAFYRPSTDAIHMPDREAFASQRAITSVLAHEAVHATGAQPRLAREFGRRFGDRAYAVEEIVAELGAAMLLGTWGYRVEERADHAQYVASWLHVLREQPRAIMTIASAAQRAADFLLEAAGAASPSVPEAQPEAAE